METKRESISEILRRAIDRVPSINALAKSTGVPRMSIHRFMNGETSLRLDNAERLAEFFGLELREREGK